MDIAFSPKLPLTANQTHYDVIFDISENIKQNFKNLVLTIPGERVMLPDFGCGLKRFLFENQGYIAELEVEITTLIQKQVTQYLNYIQLDEISVSNPVDSMGNLIENRLDIIIKFSVPSINLSDYLVINT
jgi:hypothetical protein